MEINREEILQQLKQIFSLTDELIPRVAGVYYKLYNELQKKGFTKKESIAIVANYKIGGPN